MRKAVIPKVSSTSADADDWETDPDFVNDVNEEQQRWGASSRTVGAIDMSALREATKQEDQQCKKKLLEEGPNAAYGYGGKFGVQADRMDKSAVGHEHIEQIPKHASQKDYATGFGGKYGVQADRVDKSAVGWDHKENLQKHASQKDYSTGFGGKFGVQTDRIDKSAVGWDHKENVAKHASQTDYATGFGGKYGVQTDRVDKSAVGWDHKENMSKHASQKDYAAGFGGKFGVQTDRVDKAAVGWDHKETVPKHASQIDHSMGFGGKYGVQSDRMDSSAKGWEDGEGSDRLRARKTSSSQPDEVKEAEQKASQLKQRFEQMAKSNAEQAQSKPLPKKLPTVAKAPVQQPTPPPAQVDPIPQNIPRVEDTEQQTRDEPVLTRVSIQDTPLLAPEVNEIPQDSEVTPEDAWQETQEWEEEGQAGDVYENVGEDAGLVAIALYDYQAAAEDELSFDPDDVITNIEMIDEGWWRGELNGKCGLFPANYVTLQNQ